MTSSSAQASQRPRRVLVLGSSYGSLFAAKVLSAGHDVTLVGQQSEVDVISREGTRVQLPLRSGGTVVLDSRELPGRLLPVIPEEVNPSGVEMAVLALSEPQYAAPEITSLLDRLGQARVPCLSLMNMPPLPFLRRILGAQADECRDAYWAPDAWTPIDANIISLCSPDPQAYRPNLAAPNELHVTLATNFKAAPFADASHTAVLIDLAESIDAASGRASRSDGATASVPVRLVVRDSVFAPLAKWPMLLTGNYRCVMETGVRSIADAVHQDIVESKRIYEQVANLCMQLGASAGDLVPFEQYADAAKGLSLPSAAARALAGGATKIERMDQLVNRIAELCGADATAYRLIVQRVSARIDANSKRATL